MALDDGGEPEGGDALAPFQRGASYLIIIELSPEVWEVQAFRARNKTAAARRDRGERVQAVYIGRSYHRAACRFAIYQGSRLCTCGLQANGRVQHGMASHWVKDFGVRVSEERLLDGVGWAALVIGARALAVSMRKAGVGVWQVP